MLLKFSVTKAKKTLVFSSQFNPNFSGRDRADNVPGNDP